MTTLKEIQVSSIGEPCYIKVERNSKGYNYEMGIHAETMNHAFEIMKLTKEKIEGLLYGGEHEHKVSL